MRHLKLRLSLIRDLLLNRYTWSEKYQRMWPWSSQTTILLKREDKECLHEKVNP